jgi:cytoskeletal protein RodZ
MKIKIISIALLIVVLLSGLAYAGFQSQKNNTTDRTLSPEKSEQNQKKTKQTNSPANDEPLTTTQQPDNNPATKPNSSNQKGSLTISTAQDAGDVVIVRTVVNDISSGECLLKATNGSRSITKTAPLGLVTNYYTCQGFDIEQNELGPGAWSINVSIGGVSSGATKVEVK